MNYLSAIRPSIFYLQNKNRPEARHYSVGCGAQCDLTIAFFVSGGFFILRGRALHVGKVDKKLIGTTRPLDFLKGRG